MKVFDQVGGLRCHVVVPLLAFVALAIVFECTTLDLWLADLIYRWEGGVWALRRDPLVRDVLHSHAKQLTGVVYGLIASLCAMSFVVARLSMYRWGLVYLVSAIAISTLSVSLLKDVTHVYCPWSVARYGGDVPYVPNWRAILAQEGDGRCFPSGHASSGFALLALYFFCARYAPALRWYTFAMAMVLGTVFGVAQQLRGAHFLSHDVWALAICWFVAVIATPILYRDWGTPQRAGGAE